jgi:hypothetical protein
MNCEAPNGLYRESLYIKGGNSATGKYDPPRIITALSTIQKIGVISSTQNARRPTVAYINNVRIEPKMMVKTSVGIKILAYIVGGSPIKNAKTIEPNIVITKKEYNP